MSNENFERIATSLNESSTHLQELRAKYDGAFTRLDEKKTQSEAAVEAKKTQALAELEASKAELGEKVRECEDYIQLIKNGTAPVGLITQIQENKVFTLGDEQSDDFKSLDEAFKFLSTKFCFHGSGAVTIKVKKDITLDAGYYITPFQLRIIGDSEQITYTRKLTINSIVALDNVFFQNLTIEVNSNQNDPAYFYTDNKFIIDQCKIITNHKQNNTAFFTDKGLIVIATCIFEGSNNNFILVNGGGYACFWGNKQGTIQANVGIGGVISISKKQEFNAVINTNIAKNTLTSSGIVYEN